nr:ATP-binding protein [Kibdelosporangium phytohabitans]
MFRRGTPRIRRVDTFSPTDFFGLDEEARVLASQVREIYTPYRPVRTRDLLFGREAEVVAVVEALNTPGRHAFVCGERGVGKTSLAAVVATLLTDATSLPHTVKRCDPADTFESVLERPLTALGVDVHRIESTVQHTRARNTNVSIGTTGIKKERQLAVGALYRPDGRVGVAEAAEHLKAAAGLLVVDEADAITDPTVLTKVATLIKHLSDLGSPFKVLIVGTPETAAALTTTHPSARHCVKTVTLRPLATDALGHLVRTGGEALGFAFADEVVAGIARASAGHPHFAHLLALTCAEKAVVDGRRDIAPADLIYAMAAATGEVDPGLPAAFIDAVDGDLASPAVDLLKKAAIADGPEFESDTVNPAFVPVRPGVYRFADPRMRPYLRIRFPFG